MPVSSNSPALVDRRIPSPRRGGNVSSASLLVVFAATIGVLHAWGEDPRSETITVQDTPTGHLIVVTPSFRLLARNLSIDPSVIPPPLTAIGYDLDTGDGIQKKNPGEVLESSPFKLSVYWRVTSRIAPRSDMVLRVAGSGPVLEQAYSADTSAWKLGGAYRTTLDYAGKGSRYAGNATMSLLLKSATSDGREIVVLKEPITIRPVKARSSVADGPIRATFGLDAVRLNAALRLGKGARIEIPLSENPAREFAGAGLISATGYSGTFDVGADVLRVGFIAESGERASYSLIYGEGTFHGETTLVERGDKSSVNAETFSPGNSALPHPGRSLFVGRLVLGQPQKIRAIELEYVPSTGVIDIAEIVLLPTTRSPGPEAPLR